MEAAAMNGSIYGTQSTRSPKSKELDGYVGFANLPNQIYRNIVKKGFEFNLMIVGESGLGKSTMINTMFLTEIYNAEYPGPSLRLKKTITVEENKVMLKENGVNLTLTIIDTPGFGDAVDNSNCWQPVIEYIDKKYEEYLNSELWVIRRQKSDSRVHCCLYFIAPSGHGLKQLDIEFMQRLHDKVNIIPVIAKADSMTPDECASFKKQILNEIAKYKIKIFEFPEDDDEEENKMREDFKNRIPFAIIGANQFIEHEGRKVRARKYPWGIVEVDNLKHNDFFALQNLMIHIYLQDFKNVTNNVHYEKFRCHRLAGLIDEYDKFLIMSDKSPLAHLEKEKREHENQSKKLEIELERVFELKVREKMQRLKDLETDLQRKQEQMEISLQRQNRELEEKKQAFELERLEWERQTNTRRITMTAKYRG